jgi:transposase
MALYWGIDLHSNNHVVVAIDEEDHRVFEKRLGNDLELTLSALAPYRQELVGVAVESTVNWYWLVDGLQAAGYPMKRVNTTAVQHYAGLKYTDDRDDAYWLAHLLWLGLLPTGSIYPKEQRGIRDLLRCRMPLVPTASQQLISLQSPLWRQTGEKVSSGRLRQAGYRVELAGAAERLAAEATLQGYRAIQDELELLERVLLEVVKPRKDFQVLTTIPGDGAILGMTIALETGDIHRFADVGMTPRTPLREGRETQQRHKEGRRQCQEREPIPVLGLFGGRAFRRALRAFGEAVFRAQTAQDQRHRGHLVPGA